MFNLYYGEEFVDILGDGNYWISNCGRVYSRFKDDFIKHTTNEGGYERVLIQGKNYFVHRLVAFCFLRYPTDKGDVNALVVDHIDGNTHNNNVFNLRWATQSDNNRARRRGLNNG